MTIRVANRTRTDALIIAMLDEQRPFDEWTYLEDVAKKTDMTLSQVKAAANHLALEYDAVSYLRVTGAIRLNYLGVDKYFAVDRNFDESRLGEQERMNAYA